MYEIVETPKQEGQTKAQVVAALRKERPGFRIVAVTQGQDEDGNDVWLAEIEQRVSSSKREAEFPFEKKDEKEAPKSEDSDDDDDEDSDDDDDDDDSEESDEKGEKKEGDPLGRLKELVSEIQGLFDDLAGHADEVATDADEKQKKVDEVHKLVDEHASEPNPAAVGPTPGGPDSALPPESMPQPGGKPPAPGAPRKRRPAPAGPTAFSRRTEIAKTAGVDEEGNRISLSAAALALEAQDEWADYEVTDIRHQGDIIIAKMQLRETE